MGKSVLCETSGLLSSICAGENRFEEEMSNTSRMITRRKLLALMSAAFLSRSSLRGQDGMASRGLAPAPRAKPSGRSFAARFVDVAAEGGARNAANLGAGGEKNI